MLSILWGILSLMLYLGGGLPHLCLVYFSFFLLFERGLWLSGELFQLVSQKQKLSGLVGCSLFPFIIGFIGLLLLWVGKRKVRKEKNIKYLVRD